jgi:hypothetical protein
MNLLRQYPRIEEVLAELDESEIALQMVGGQ